MAFPTSSSVTRWTQPTTLFSTMLAMYIGYRTVQHLNALLHHRAIEPSPIDPLLKNNIQFVSVNGKKLRIVHIPHALGSKVPLVVFIHGVGGQVTIRIERHFDLDSMILMFLGFQSGHAHDSSSILKSKLSRLVPTSSRSTCADMEEAMFLRGESSKTIALLSHYLFWYNPNCFFFFSQLRALHDRGICRGLGCLASTIQERRHRADLPLVWMRHWNLALSTHAAVDQGNRHDRPQSSSHAT